jgi:hypothetical protein
MLRRTQAITIEINGMPTRIGDSIPAYRVCTVELGSSDAGEFEAYSMKDYQKSIMMGRIPLLSWYASME